eukprot:scpid80815/ scgid16750/ Platelet glycoprotein Ib alpha chain; Antigen CD42b-alpha; Glycocalicin
MKNRREYVRPVVLPLLLVIVAVACNIHTASAQQACVRGMDGAILHISCAGKQLTALPTISTADKPNLNYLIFSSNAMTTLNKQALQLPALTRLDLSYNKMLLLPSGAFDGLPKLQALDLSFNDILELPVGIFKKNTELETLFCAHNRLITLPADVFKTNPKLVNLNFWHNKLFHIPSGLFVPLPNLLNLNFNENSFGQIQAGAFSGMNTIAIIRLRGNPLYQDHRLCSALYYPEERFDFELNYAVKQNYFQWHTVNDLCGRPCNTFRTTYMNICPNAFCTGTVAAFQCHVGTWAPATAELTCDETSSILTMFSSKEVTPAGAAALCTLNFGRNGHLPTPADFAHGCVTRTVAKARARFGLAYDPVVWLGQKSLETYYASDRYTYRPTRKLYFMCSRPSSG